MTEAACVRSPGAGYGRFSSRLHGKAAARRLPISGSVELTARCNLSCAHCYVNRSPGDREAQMGELSARELDGLLGQIAEAGCLWLLLTGGEPLVRADFPDIYGNAVRKGLLVTLFTNGTLLTPELADHLERWRPFSVEITLHGGTRETYERITGVPGSYDSCLRGVRLLAERGVPLKLKSSVLSLNRHEISAMRRLAEEDLGVPFRYDAMITPRLSCATTPLALRLRPEQVVALDLADHRRKAEWSLFARQFNGPVHPPGRDDELFHCGGGVTNFAVDSAGRLKVCGFYPGEGWDLRRGSFSDGWKECLAKIRSTRITRRTRCTSCEIKAMCGMCPAHAWLEQGDPETPVSFFCEVAHLRAYALGFTVPPHGDCPYCPGGDGHRHLVDSLRTVS